MTVRDALSRVKTVRLEALGTEPAQLPPVFETVARELAAAAGANVEVTETGDDVQEAGVFRIKAGTAGSRVDGDAVHLQLGPDGAAYLEASTPRFLYAFVTHLLRDLADRELSDLEDGKTFAVAFGWVRSTYDFFLTQEARIQKGLDRAAYVRRLAESGFTHVEVNGLAFPTGIESGPPGEAYPMFYTYCPALDQFVESDLAKGLYPRDYLSANLAFLRRNAALALKYGLEPGLLCFEPRNVPEAFFERYPMLRGARVDHPFRSFKPRYNMTIAHPRVREHYAQMVERLHEAVPELAFLSVWSNDSGAGFEHTQSLYVGRNGGAYLIREWKTQEDIARAAGGNALRFLRTLRDAGRKTRPDFRVLTRMESFYGEHEVIWQGLENGLEVETSCLATRGWEIPYDHPRYPGSRSYPAGSVYQQELAPEEGRLAAELEARSSGAHFYVGAGPWLLFAPLVGVPYPGLTFRRLKLLRDGGVRKLANMGGTHPPAMAPFNVNHEVLRAFQFDPQMALEPFLRHVAATWAGERRADTLLKAWGLVEEAIEAFPHVSALYSMYGFVWYRLWVRPLVPDIEAIPLEERAYYQDHMCTTPHNPNNVDLARDVLFQLATVQSAREAMERMDAHVWQPLDRAIALLSDVREEAAAIPGHGQRGGRPARALPGAPLLAHDPAERRGLDRRRGRVHGGHERRRAVPGADAGAADDRGGAGELPSPPGAAGLRCRLHGDDGPGGDAARLRREPAGVHPEAHGPHGGPPGRRALHRSGLHGAPGGDACMNSLEGPDMGPDVMETFTPPTLGGDADLARTKERIGSRVCRSSRTKPGPVGIDLPLHAARRDDPRLPADDRNGEV